jgi:acetyltransferase-like isoleucine patch superfamily enzyme
LLGPIPGLLGFYLRQKFYKTLLGRLGRGVIIGKDVVFWQPLKIFIDSNSMLRDHAFLSVRGDSHTNISIGKNVFVGRHSTIKARTGTVNIEDFAVIGDFCRIGTTSTVKIGSHTAIAAFCYIGAGEHRFHKKSELVRRQDIENKKGVSIGKDVWLGAHVTVLDGINIGDGTIVGANSLVTKDLPEHVVAHGIPATVKGKRG